MYVEIRVWEDEEVGLRCYSGPAEIPESYTYIHFGFLFDPLLIKLSRKLCKRDGRPLFLMLERGDESARLVGLWLPEALYRQASEMVSEARHPLRGVDPTCVPR